MKRLANILILSLMVLFISGCASSRGNTYDNTQNADKNDNKAKTETTTNSNSTSSTSETEEKEVVEDIKTLVFTINSSPQGAAVYLDNRYAGKTPLELYQEDGYGFGSYEIRLELTGYYSYQGYFNCTSTGQSFHFKLEQITGFLELESDSEVYHISLDGRAISRGKQRLGIGRYRLRAYAFGYVEENQDIVIEENQTTRIYVSLPPAAFEISRLGPSKSRFNPQNPGSFSQVEISFHVTSFGRAEIFIYGPDNQEVFQKNISAFFEENQRFFWNGRKEGIILPDGQYRILIKAIDERGGDEHILSSIVNIDSSLALNYRSILSGQSGTLLTACTDQMAEDYAQISGLFLGHIGEDGSLRAPLALGFRLGLYKETELTLQTTVIARDAAYLPFFLSAGVRTLLFRGAGDFTLSSAAQLKGVFHYGTGADTLSLYTGLSLSLPLQFQLGPLSLILQPDIAIGPWEITYTADYDSHTAFFAWAYGRAALLFDHRGFTTALSAAVRTLSFDKGFALAWPMQMGAEFHFFIPGSQTLISFSALGEFDSIESWYIMGGLGFNFLM
ncbi:MAG: PEGA domain-containing protein [Spirochaetales bacterium]|nr:PEGA domain-containing protein [Spirochaetales bacterium]